MAYKNRFYRLGKDLDDNFLLLEKRATENSLDIKTLQQHIEELDERVTNLENGTGIEPPIEPPPIDPPPTQPIFKREGYGSTTTGGEGGPVYPVTDERTLREAVAASGHRIIRQMTPIPILTTSTVTIRNPHVTLENLNIYNAPGQEHHTLQVSGAHDVIVSNSRISNPEKGQRDVIQIRDGGHNILVERCTLMFGDDEIVNSWDSSHDITFAWNIIAYPLNHANHGYGPLFGAADRGGGNISFHHNLLSTSRYRNPKLDILGGFSMWNNVIYNCGEDTNTLWEPNDGMPGDAWGTIENNVYLEGPNSGKTTAILLRQHGIVHVDGNEQDGHPAGIYGLTPADARPNDLPPMTVTDLTLARAEVLEFAGAKHETRNQYETQIIRDARDRTSRVPAGRWVNTPADVGWVS